MMYQIFPVPRAFNRLQRRHWHAGLYLPVSRSQSKVNAHRTRKGQTCRLSERVFAPNPLVRAAKIAHLRHAVENGDYCVGPEQIADKMIQEAMVEMFTS
jgi:anti-sigma28 factor (negative regulator of flagellin synthesis)